MANLIEVSRLSKVDVISGLQSRSNYIPKGFIPSGLNLSIGESFSSFIAPKAKAVPLAVGVLECLGLNLAGFEDLGISNAVVSTGVLTASTIGVFFHF